MIINVEYVQNWKEVVLIYLKVAFQNSPKESMESHEILHQGQAMT